MKRYIYIFIVLILFKKNIIANHDFFQIDEFIEQNIQINSNKKIRREYLSPWTLKFKDTEQELKFCQLREDMFR